MRTRKERERGKQPKKRDIDASYREGEWGTLH